MYTTDCGRCINSPSVVHYFVSVFGFFRHSFRMKKIVLLVQNEEQAAQLGAAGKVIGRIGQSKLWVLCSPAIQVDVKEATKTFDAEIAVLNKSIKDAADREDFKTSEEYKAKRETVQANRSVEIRNAWKRATPEDRKKGLDKHLAPMLKAIDPKQFPANVKINILAEHQEPATWVSMVGELSGVWRKDFEPGTFALMWPQSVIELGELIDSLVARPVESTSKITPPNPWADALKSASYPNTLNTRESELKAMRFFSLAAVAKGLGIDAKGKKSPQLVAEILAAESAKAAA